MEYEQQAATAIRGGERFLSSDCDVLEVQTYDKQNGDPLHPENEDDFDTIVILYNHSRGYETHIQYGILLSWIATRVLEPLKT